MVNGRRETTEMKLKRKRMTLNTVSTNSRKSEQEKRHHHHHHLHHYQLPQQTKPTGFLTCKLHSAPLRTLTKRSITGKTTTVKTAHVNQLPGYFLKKQKPVLQK